MNCEKATPYLANTAAAHCKTSKWIETAAVLVCMLIWLLPLTTLTIITTFRWYEYRRVFDLKDMDLADNK